jgi:hypothetical protein
MRQRGVADIHTTLGRRGEGKAMLPIYYSSTVASALQR